MQVFVHLIICIWEVGGLTLFHYNFINHLGLIISINDMKEFDLVT